ncbi:MAG: DNA internalization-related competence protein ComEC/Rec2 [Steroidobacteraceae bacterium]
MLRIAIAFLLGHCAVWVLRELPSAWSIGSVLGTLLFASACLRWPALGALAVGGLLAWIAGSNGLQGDLAPALEGREVSICGRVVSLPERHEGGVQFDFELDERCGSSPTEGLPRIARLTWYSAEAMLQPGERWQLRVRMKRRHGFANPGGFDYEGALFRADVGATGYVREDSTNARLAANGSREILLRIRGGIAATIARAARGDAFTGVLQGLAVGVQDAMSAEQWRVFAMTGTTHLMAISGLHIGMVASVFAWLGGVGIVRLCPQRWGFTLLHGQALGGIAGALGYSALAGMSVPTQRTLIMLCVYLVTRAMRRPVDVTHTLALALILVLLADPFAPLAPGSWLSFLAVAAILCSTLGRRGRGHLLPEFGRVQWAVTIGLLPVVVASFGTVSLVSPLANAVAIPVFTGLLVPLVLICTIVATFSLTAGGLCFQVPLWLLHVAWRALQAMSQWPWATWHMPAVEPWAYLLFGLGALAFLIPAIWPVRLAAGLLCLPAFMNAPRAPVRGEAQVTVLDVGQGLSTVVRTRSHTLVYDTGPLFRSGRDTSELVVLPFLWHAGIRRVDVLMISHSDMDHAGGMSTFLREMSGAQVLHGPSLPLRAGSRHCASGQRWTWDDVVFTVLHPAARSDWSDNDSSCVLLVQTVGASMLLTGDIESAAEASVLPVVAPVDVVVVPHHGSRSSSSRAFVAATHPRYAIVSAGYRNRWGFPKPEVSSRWREAGARVLTTADTGAVQLQLTSRAVADVCAYRAMHRRFWNWRSDS